MRPEKGDEVNRRETAGEIHSQGLTLQRARIAYRLQRVVKRHQRRALVAANRHDRLTGKACPAVAETALKRVGPPLDIETMLAERGINESLVSPGNAVGRRMPSVQRNVERSAKTHSVEVRRKHADRFI